MKNLRPSFLAVTIKCPALIAARTNWNVSCRPVALRAAEVLHLPPAHLIALPAQVQIAAVVIEKNPVNPFRKGIGLFRIGFGYDAHRFVEDRLLILCGTQIPHPLGLEGHSDADVLVHAIIDAVIGALGRGDIGHHFPDTDPAYKGACSLNMLKTVAEWVKRDGYRLNNLDATLVAQRPRMTSYLPSMRSQVAQSLETTAGQVNIKATTTERMGFCGRGEGIEAFAVASLIAISE